MVKSTETGKFFRIVGSDCPNNRLALSATPLKLPHRIRERPAWCTSVQYIVILGNRKIQTSNANGGVQAPEVDGLAVSLNA